jgi:hypothetical protein
MRLFREGGATIPGEAELEPDWVDNFSALKDDATPPIRL